MGANDPLFTQAEVKQIKEAELRAINPEYDAFTRMTFIVRKDLLEKLRDYAYTERIDIKDAINQALDSFLSDKTDLLSAPSKPKQTRKRGDD